MNNVYHALSIALTVGAVVFALRSPRNAFAAAVFFLPWTALATHVGVTVSTARLLSCLVLAWWTTRWRVQPYGPIAAFLGFAFALTVAHSLDLPGAVHEYPPLEGVYRPFLQMAMWAIYAAPAIVANDPAFDAAPARCFKIILLSSSVLALLGIVQYAVFTVSGVDVLPIGLLNPDPSAMRSGLLGESEAFLGGFRVSSLGGEPKHLAYTLVVALVIVAADVLFGGVVGLGRRTITALWAVLLIALVLTFSTQGFVLLGAGLGILFAVAACSASARVMRRAVGALAVLVACGFLVASNGGLRDTLVSRTVGRVASQGALEDFNVAIVEWLRDYPEYAVLGVGLGNAHLFAMPYADSRTREFVDGKIFVAKSGALRLLSEIGIVGLVLFVWAYLKGVGRLRRGNVLSSRGVWAVCLAVLANFLLSSNGPYFVFVVLAAALGAGGRLRVPGRTESCGVNMCSSGGAQGSGDMPVRYPNWPPR